MNTWLPKLALLWLAAGSCLLPAKDTALLIGLSYKGAPEFKDALPGIDLDIRYMKEIARNLGYQDVRVLWDEQATLDGIFQAFAKLARDTTPSDRTLIFYSGHGSQVKDRSGDEADGLDEVLVPYDVNIKDVLLDDTLGGWLDQLPSQQILVIVDACHSGTGTRALGFGNEGVKAKYINLKETPTVREGGARSQEHLDDFLSKSKQTGKFASLMAAKDTEVAGATERGSRFTVALKQAFDSAVSSRTCSVELEKLFQMVQSNVARATARSEHPQTPQMTAEDPVLRKQTLNLDGVAGCQRTAPISNRMQYWHDFAGKAGERLSVRSNGASLPVHPNPESAQRCSATAGLLTIEVTAPRDGYLHVLNIGEGDTEATVLFPNKYAQNNKVTRGQVVRIPAPGSSWCLPARLPAGMSQQQVLLVAGFTDYQVNLFTDGKGNGPFREVPNGSRSFAAEAGKTPLTYAAGEVIVTIQK